MNALVFDQGLQLASRPIPEARKDETLVKVSLAGVCSTDLEILQGYMEFSGVPGHEFVGIAVNGPLAGSRVVGEINCACMSCPTCSHIGPRHCPHRTVMGIQGRDGAFAQFLLLPTRNLHAVPHGIPDQAAVFTEPLAAALEIIEQVDLDKVKGAVVIGDGKLGILVAQVLRDKGITPELVGRPKCAADPSRAPSGKASILAGLGFEPFYPENLEELPQAAADLVIEASGAPEGLEEAMRMVRPRGTIVLKSTYQRRSGVCLAPLVINEITLLGSRCGPFPPALAMLAGDRIVCRPLIERTFPLSHGVEAIEHAGRKGSLKVLIDCA